MRPPSEPSPAPAHDAAGDVVRWAVFSCLLVPAVLVAHGTSVGSAALWALGLACVTTACRILLRRSERTPAHVGEGAHRRGR
ncbi:hypothetical protein CIB93_08275 [Streptomyces sp. WZ.A104]|uniref:Uncharacterized protein n=1 Tax=Streptomyces durocortorensis TaxID=2811104 RepID=A0ABY9W5C7_9ACTN|nr:MULTISPECIES: hypothetical protein [Streptomyces]PCG86555.1 hypothetical protein CIB93_08275 [Streptomyces sp. WZ.A104]WNF31218.1 hypothetical protein RI138_10285 [Streptomyces durocortorensis]